VTRNEGMELIGRRVDDGASPAVPEKPVCLSLRQTFGP
jgi:hypothetical protein